MNVLVVNAGSSSLKYQLLDTDTREVFAKGNCERIGSDMGIFGHSENGGAKQTEEVPFPDHRSAIARVLEELEKTDFTIDGIGHRIVQGGWHFDDSAVVDDEVMAKILEVAPLAPLHNYGEAAAIEYCREKYPELPNVAVFDTSFHMTMPEVAYTYALPKDVCDKYHVRKYGAHGTSHRYEWMMAKEILGSRCHRLLSCHLGNGASLAAIEDGVPVLAICGGYQMLGETLADPEGTESGTAQTVRGLGLLPTRTVFTGQKHRTQDTAAVTAAPFAGAALTGYQIHTGRTEVQGVPFCTLADGTPEGCVQDNVFGTYLHGLFDSGELTEQFAAYLCRRKGIDPAAAAPISMQEYRTQQLDLLADGVRHNLDLAAVYAAMGLAQPAERGNDQ